MTGGILLSEFARLWPEADKGKSREGTERMTEQTEGSAEGWRVRKGGLNGWKGNDRAHLLSGTLALCLCALHFPFLLLLRTNPQIIFFDEM